MATDFTNNNNTIDATGGFKPKTKNTPLDMRTRVNLKADIESIPNPFVGMKIIVLQDETNDNQMTEYVVTQDNGIGGKVIFNKEVAGANGEVKLTIDGNQYAIYGEILLSPAETFIYIDKN